MKLPRQRSHGLPLAAASLCLVLLKSATAADFDFEKEILPVLAERCTSCHSTAKHKGDLDLERFATLTDVKNDPAVWEAVLDQISSGEMPPKDEPAFDPDQKSLFTSWVQKTLDEVALASAGDPGPVVLRRLSNMEYTYTVRDLTGIASLDPAHEFPVDGAAGEGFTNVGSALVMSPSLLTKYLDAAKSLAAHAVLTPDGIRFSAHTSPQDWTGESLDAIRSLYARFSASGNATAVDLQGVKFDTNAGGRLPVEHYLDALQGKPAPAGLSPKYLATLKRALTAPEPSLLLDPLRAKFRSGTLEAADIAAWQGVLWRFASVGHIGKANGPAAWQEPVNPLVTQHELRLKLSPPEKNADTVVFLATSDAGDGPENDFALWENARLVAPDRADLPLSKVRETVALMDRKRALVTTATARCLAAAHEAERATSPPDPASLAEKHGADPALLAAWLAFLGISSQEPITLGPLLIGKLEGTPDYSFIKGWTGENALSVLANSSDASVRIPGTMAPHSVATHPSPTLASAIAWRSPVDGDLQIRGLVQHAHPECGNGIAWSLELSRGSSRETLDNGFSKGADPITLGPFGKFPLSKGDAVVLIIAPLDGDHSCDLTAVNLTLQVGSSEWDLAKDVSPDILASNPHPDRLGNPDVWHFFSQPAGAQAPPAIPPGSLLARWRQAADPAERTRLATEIQQLLERPTPTPDTPDPDRALHSQLLAPHGPLLSRLPNPDPEAALPPSPYGPDPALFGKHPLGSATSPDSLCVSAPSLIEIRLPAWLAENAELVATAKLHPASAPEGSVQMQILTAKPDALSGIAAGQAESSTAQGQWSDNNLRTRHSSPIITAADSPAHRSFVAAFDTFRSLFPVALCYTKIVPVDEVVTLTLFYREDDHLKRLMLDEAEIAELDRLWAELRSVSEAPLKQVDAFDQLWQFATQDAKPEAFEPMRQPILKDAESFAKEQVEAQPKHVRAVTDFATRAWRRPLTGSERSDLHALYQTLRQQDLPHADALRLLLARVLVAPAFLYRGESAAPGSDPAPINDFELATRLSYFLWSSTPDPELLDLAAAGQLRDPDVLAAQARRMVKDPRIRRLATEFACQWLHIRDVATLDEKSERHFPTFPNLRESMQEEAVRFFVDFFQNDLPVTALLDSDHSFVNGPLADHYGLPANPDEWRRVEGMRDLGRGGILGFAATLSKQSGASRTSPILRGTWLSEVILGDKLPNPPKGVPVLPEVAPDGLTERQLTERHTSDPNCASCHRRVDPFGFALEGFDAIGRARVRDVAGLLVDSRAELPDGTHIEGLPGLRSYLLTARRDEFLRQFSRKLLGYALGRSVQLSDKPLLDSILANLASGDHRVGIAIDLIVRSPQFRNVRGRDFAPSP